MASPRTVTILAAALADTDAIKTSVASSASAASYDADDLNGAAAPGSAVATANIVSGLPSFVVVTVASNAGSYVAGSKITVTGTFNGDVQTEELEIVGTDGNEVLLGDVPFDTVSGIDIEAQENTSGAFTFGFSGIGTPKRNTRFIHWQGFVGAETGNIHVKYHDGNEDTIPTDVGRDHPAAPARFYADSTAGFTLYWPVAA
jgi:hypothetical protein